MLATTGNPINLRFPGQWFQAESGLHQNWMRDYDPTTGRYMQADPLGLVDGASIYGYALQNPGRYVDPRGENIIADYLSGMGSWGRGIYRCVFYCGDETARQNMSKLAKAMQDDPQVEECVYKMLEDYANSNKVFLSGRVTFPAIAAVGAKILTRGRISAGVSGGAALGGTGLAFGGDMSYMFGFDGGLTPENISRAIAGSMGGSGEAEIPCECQEVLSELTP